MANSIRALREGMNVKKALLLMLAIPWAMAIAVPARAQAGVTGPQRTAEDAEYDKRAKIQRRAFELRPRRRDEPLRYKNISDIEVREIQQMAAEYFAKTMLNISPVIQGCPCEEGPSCTAQVYVVTYANENARGLQLSQVRNSWQVGIVQQWWLKYDTLRARMPKMDYEAYESAESDLFREFPECVGELVPAAKTASSQKVEPKK